MYIWILGTASGFKGLETAGPGKLRTKSHGWNMHANAGPTPISSIMHALHDAFYFKWTSPNTSNVDENHMQNILLASVTQQKQIHTIKVALGNRTALPHCTTINRLN